jgi:putative transposase
VTLVEREGSELSVMVQCALLSLNRSGLYYASRGPDERELLIKRRIDEVYTACPFYGIRKITAQLRVDGLLVNHKAVARHMQEMGLRAIAPGPNLSKRAQQHEVYPYLLHGLKIKQPNQVWGVDITYIRLRSGWMYLFAVLGRVLPLCRQLGARFDPGNRLRPERHASGSLKRHADHL